MRPLLSDTAPRRPKGHVVLVEMTQHVATHNLLVPEKIHRRPSPESRMAAHFQIPSGDLGYIHTRIRGLPFFDHGRFQAFAELLVPGLGQFPGTNEQQFQSAAKRECRCRPGTPTWPSSDMSAM